MWSSPPLCTGHCIWPMPQCINTKCSLHSVHCGRSLQPYIWAGRTHKTAKPQVGHLGKAWAWAFFVADLWKVDLNTTLFLGKFFCKECKRLVPSIKLSKCMWLDLTPIPGNSLTRLFIKEARSYASSKLRLNNRLDYSRVCRATNAAKKIDWNDTEQQF